MSDDKRANKPIWKPPTRRAFVAMLGLGAAALAARTRSVGETASPQLPTRWIGHC